MLKDTNYYRYIRERDQYGDAKNVKDIIDFPVIQQEEKPEYTVFLDLLEEEFKGKTILALQEYKDFNSPIGESLCEMRSTFFKKASSVEDFVNPLDEPAKNIPYRYQVEHAYFYKDDNNDLCVVRIGHNDKEGDIIVKETLYDISNLPSQEKKVMYSSVGHWYLDKETFGLTKKMLNRNNCGLGEHIYALYTDRMKKTLVSKEEEKSVKLVNKQEKQFVLDVEHSDRE